MPQGPTGPSNGNGVATSPSKSGPGPVRSSGAPSGKSPFLVAAAVAAANNAKSVQLRPSLGPFEAHAQVELDKSAEKIVANLLANSKNKPVVLKERTPCYLVL